jgi:hypothetical protein
MGLRSQIYKTPASLQSLRAAIENFLGCERGAFIASGTLMELKRLAPNLQKKATRRYELQSSVSCQHSKA